MTGHHVSLYNSFKIENCMKLKKALLICLYYMIWQYVWKPDIWYDIWYLYCKKALKITKPYTCFIDFVAINSGIFW